MVFSGLLRSLLLAELFLNDAVTLISNGCRHCVQCGGKESITVELKFVFSRDFCQAITKQDLEVMDLDVVVDKYEEISICLYFSSWKNEHRRNCVLSDY